MDIYLDIETLPTDDPETIAVLRENAKAPANLVDPEKIARAREKNYMKAHRETALNGTYGRIAVIAWYIDESRAHSADESIDRESVDHIALLLAVEEHERIEEAELLRTFFARVDGVLKKTGTRRLPWFIGFNIGFDLRFIWRRAVIHGLRPPFTIPYNAAPWNNKYLDLIYHWCGAKEYIKQKELCRVLGINDDGDIDGSEVAHEWAMGNHQKVIDHCISDVVRLRELHNRMMLSIPV
jgi:hypothetical protein